MNFLNLTNLENKPLLKYLFIVLIAVNAIALVLLLFGPGRLFAANAPGGRDNASAAVTDEASLFSVNEETDDHDGEDADEEADLDSSGSSAEAASSETAAAAEEEESTTGPILELNTDRVTLTVGSYFNYWDYIETVRDRDGSDLSQYIHLSEQPNMYTPGEYTVTYQLTSPVTGETSSKDLIVTVEY